MQGPLGEQLVELKRLPWVNKTNYYYYYYSFFIPANLMI